MLLLLGVIIIILDSAELYDSVQVLNSELQNCTSKFCDPIVSWTEPEVVLWIGCNPNHEYPTSSNRRQVDQMSNVHLVADIYFA